MYYSIWEGENACAKSRTSNRDGEIDNKERINRIKRGRRKDSS